MQQSINLIVIIGYASHERHMQFLLLVQFETENHMDHVYFI